MRLLALRNEGIFTPLAEQPTLLFPGSLGGANWGGGAYSPQTQRLIVNVNAAPFVAQLIRGTAPERSRTIPSPARRRCIVTMQGTPYTLAVGPLLSPLGIPCTAPPWGKLVAVDLAQGRIAWEAPLGSVHEMGPFPLPWHINWGTPNLGGGLVTDGGVFFIGATMDRQFRAFDVRDGRQLWSYELPIDATATPMSYALQRPAVRADQCRWARDVQPRHRRLPDRLCAARQSAARPAAQHSVATAGREAGRDRARNPARRPHPSHDRASAVAGRHDGDAGLVVSRAAARQGAVRRRDCGRCITCSTPPSTAASGSKRRLRTASPASGPAEWWRVTSGSARTTAKAPRA